jgi:hypothetical protein
MYIRVFYFHMYIYICIFIYTYISRKDHWTVDALWEMTYFMIFVAIAVMWAPNVNMQKYAYSIELSNLGEIYSHVFIYKYILYI